MTRTLRLAIACAVPLILLPACKKQASIEDPVRTTAPPKAAAAPATPAAPTAVSQMRANFSKVLFDTDSATLAGNSKELLTANAALMKANGDLRVEVQGHADERGTTDYNVALGNRRAQAVRDYLVSAGISPSRVTTVSFGEEQPIDLANTESAWSANRRAEFRVTWGDAIGSL